MDSSKNLQQVTIKEAAAEEISVVADMVDLKVDTAEQLINELDGLNYIELSLMKNKLKNSLSSLELYSTHFVEINKTIDTLEQVKKQTTTSVKDTFMNDVNEDSKEVVSPLLDEVIQDFETKEYPDSDTGKVKKELSSTEIEIVEKTASIKQILEAVEKQIESRYSGINTKASTFINFQLIESLQNKLDAIKQSSSPNKEKLEKKFNVMMDAIKNRSTLTYISTKANNPIVIANIKSEFVRLQRDNILIRRIRESISESMNINQINHIVMYLITNILGANAESVALDGSNDKELEKINNQSMMFIYHMTKMLKTEERSGNYMYIKALFMSIMEIIEGAYDLENGIEDFENQLKDILVYYK